MNLCSDPYCTICAALEDMRRTLHPLYRDSQPRPQVSRSITTSQTTPKPVLPPNRCPNCSSALLDDPQDLILAQKCSKCGRRWCKPGFSLLPYQL